MKHRVELTFTIECDPNAIRRAARLLEQWARDEIHRAPFTLQINAYKEAHVTDVKLATRSIKDAYQAVQQPKIKLSQNHGGIIR